MHVNSGDGMINGSSALPKECEDQNLPGTPGSTIVAEFMNAITGEFQSILTKAGLTLEATAAADRANGWAQAAAAIFTSKAIGSAAITDLAVITQKLQDLAVTDDKIKDLDFSKVFGEMLLTEDLGGIIAQAIINPQEFKTLLDFGGGAVGFALMNGGGVTVQSDTGRATRYLNGGMRRIGAGEESAIGLATFDMSTTGTWDRVQEWYGVCTGLPKTERILHAYVTVDDSGNVGTTGGDLVSVYDAPGVRVSNNPTFDIFSKVDFSSVDTSDDWQAYVTLKENYNNVDYSNLKLYVVFA